MRFFRVPSLLLYVGYPLIELTEYLWALLFHFGVGVHGLLWLRAVCPPLPLDCAEHPPSLLLRLGDFEGLVCLEAAKGGTHHSIRDPNRVLLIPLLRLWHLLIPRWCLIVMVLRGAMLHGTTGRPHHLAEVLHPRGRWVADVAGQVSPLLLLLVPVIVPVEIWFLEATSLPPLIRGVSIIIPLILLFLLHHTHVLPLLLE